MKILFGYVHGFGVGPEGNKAKFMKEYVKELFDEEVHCLGWHEPTFAKTTTSNAVKTLEEKLEKRIKEVGGDAKWNIVGSSYGAFLSAHLSSKRSDLFNKLILLSPAFDTLSYLKRILKNLDGLLPKKRPQSMWKRTTVMVLVLSNGIL